MPDKTVVERVIKIAAEQMGMAAKSITAETTLDETGADSLDQVELLMAWEDEFEIEIPDEVCVNWTTVQQAVDYITAQTSK
jgi:acyl carrier protein